MRAPEDQDKWLEVGASEKALSVQMLAAGLRPASLLEVGCGTGAVLDRLVGYDVSALVAEAGTDAAADGGAPSAGPVTAPVT